MSIEKSHLNVCYEINEEENGHHISLKTDNICTTA